MEKNKHEIKTFPKTLRIRFFDNDFCIPALSALDSITNCIDVFRVDDDFILQEFKYLIWYFSNLRHRAINDDRLVEKEYFDKCTLEWLDYEPKAWDNSETVFVVYTEYGALSALI